MRQIVEIDLEGGINVLLLDRILPLLESAGFKGDGEFPLLDDEGLFALFPLLGTLESLKNMHVDHSMCVTWRHADGSNQIQPGNEQLERNFWAALVQIPPNASKLLGVRSEGEDPKNRGFEIPLVPQEAGYNYLVFIEMEPGNVLNVCCDYEVVEAESVSFVTLYYQEELTTVPVVDVNIGNFPISSN